MDRRLSIALAVEFRIVIDVRNLERSVRFRWQSVYLDWSGRSDLGSHACFVNSGFETSALASPG